MPWAVAATAPNQLIAELWQGLLSGASIPTQIVPATGSMFGGVMSLPCQLMVPDDRLAEAHALLAEMLDEPRAGD